MMVSARKHLPRRLVLRGLGTCLALPLLDCMVPAHAAIRRSAASPVRRFAAIYKGLGVNMLQWTPPREGALTLSPILGSFEAFKNRTVVVSGLDSERAMVTDAGVHSRTQGTWLTGMRIHRTEARGLEAGVSMDQIAARRLGGDTQLTSLELAIEGVDLVGACEPGFSCAYTATISWRTPNTPLPMESHPRAVFERLFGDNDTTGSAARRDYVRRNRSILDAITAKVKKLQSSVDAADRPKLDEYFSAVRDVERRIQRAEEQVERELPDVDRPVGTPTLYADRARLMFDMMVLAYQADLTRVASMLLVRELSTWTYPEIGVPDSHHPLSHHLNDPEKLVRQGKIDTFHTQLVANFLQRLETTPDGDGSLLDHTLILYGSGMSNSNLHVPRDLPTVVIGGPEFGITGGRHVRVPPATPLANLQLRLLHAMDVPADQFGDSSAALTGL